MTALLDAIGYEAWILHGNEATVSADDATLRANSAKSVREVREYVERNAGGKITLRYSGGIGNDGRFLLHGPSAWYHENGSVQREASHRLLPLTPPAAPLLLSRSPMSQLPRPPLLPRSRCPHQPNHPRPAEPGSGLG